MTYCISNQFGDSRLGNFTKLVFENFTSQTASGADKVTEMITPPHPLPPPTFSFLRQKLPR